MSVTMKDVAARAGVSAATVSNVLTGNHYVSPEVRERVLCAMDEVNYHVNLNARSLKTAKTNTIGVVLPDITKLFFSEVLRGILEEAEKNGYKVVVLSSYFDFQNEKECIASLRSTNVDAIIIDTCCDYRKLQSWTEKLSSYKERYVPVTFIETMVDVSCASSVRIDTRYWAKAMTDYLVSLGKSRILYLSGHPHLSQEVDMLAGYRQALAEKGIPVREELIFGSDYESASSYRIIKDAISRGLRFDAVQASNDEAAVGSLKAMNDSGIRVPDTVVLSGFDNLFPATLVSPAITTVSVPRHEMGCAAVRESLRHIANPEAAHQSIVLDAKIIRRGSTENGLSTPWELNYW